MDRFENGLDSFKRTIKKLKKRSKNEFKLKAVVINFHHAIEVLFKHVLSLESKCLIYMDIDEWINAAFERKIGDQKNQKENIDYTISFDETIRRVIVVYDEPIDPYAYNGFRNLNKLRNAITHDEVELKLESVEQIVVTLTPVVISILQKHLTGKEKKKFEKFINSPDYKDTMQQLIGNNLEWRITTISNLLELYSGRDIFDLSKNELLHLELELSILNVRIGEKEILYEIDDEYYATYISYLKQQICDLLIHNLDKVKESEKIKDVIKRTAVIEDIIKEYLVNGTLYVYGLLNNGFRISFDKKEKIHDILDKNLLMDNLDIFVVMHCLAKIIDTLAVITGVKRRKELITNIYLDEENTETVELVYSTLNQWFQDHHWYNGYNINKLDNNIIDEIKSYEISEQIYDVMWRDGLYEELIGEWGRYGTIDRIGNFDIEEFEAIIRSEDELVVIYTVLLETQHYFDHDYFDNGTERCYIKVVGHMANDKFETDGISYLGRVIVGYNSFKFN